MKPVVLAIFAHPDDEAFGPGGTLAKFAKTHEVHLICATCGEKGQNHTSNDEKLSDLRINELRKAAKILGIKKVHFLGFIDGTLSNNLYHKLAARIEPFFEELKPEIVITFEPKGVSGHIDHITVSLVTTYVVNKFNFVKKLLYFCTLPEEVETISKGYFIYFPKGYSKKEIDWENDVTSVWDTKVKAMYAHASQRHDAERILDTLQKLPKKEHFLLYKP